MAGKLCRVTKDSPWLTEIPNHEGYRLTPMVSPELCPGAQIEFYVGEFNPDGGRALDHVHDAKINVFYVMSGRATARVGDESSQPRAGRRPMGAEGRDPRFQRRGRQRPSG